MFLELLEGDALLSIVGLLILFTSRVACHECPSVLGLPHAPRGPWNDGPEMYRAFPLQHVMQQRRQNCCKRADAHVKSHPAHGTLDQLLILGALNNMETWTLASDSQLPICLTR